MVHFDIPFLDKNSERLILSRRIREIIEMLEKKAQYNTTRVGNFFIRDGQYSPEQINEGEWREFDDETQYWGSREYYGWFKQSFDVPMEFAGHSLWYRVKPYLNKKWEETNPQLILFIDGKAVQGLDSNHQEVCLLSSAKGGEHFDIYLNAYVDPFTFREQHTMRAEIFSLDMDVIRLVYDLKTPLETANLYSADDMPRIENLKHLNEAINLLDMTGTDREKFLESVRASSNYLDENLYAKGEDNFLMSCIGHTHIDVAWLWRLRQTREKAARSFATVLQLMDEYPEYQFMSSQAQLYDYVKKDYPELYERIVQKVKSGQWEIEGAMWVEPDTNVPSGESLIRQFLVGKRFFRDEFGVDCKIMWEPDVFGYSAVLPQIMKKSGVDYFMTTKISWNEYNKVPYDTFMWHGIDGTGILSHFSPCTGFDDVKQGDFMTTYNAFLDPKHMIYGKQRYSNKELNNNALCTFGYGDGGGGPTRWMLEKGRRMNKGIPGCPKTQIEPSKKFYDRLQEEVTGHKRLPSWHGELYLEYHRGVLTAQAKNKRYNRKSEILFHDLETLATIAGKETGASYPREEITDGWKIILLNQFHDILPGSSIEDVYIDSEKQYIKLEKDATAMLENAADAITAQINVNKKAFVVFNTLGFERSDIVMADLPDGDFHIIDVHGEEVKTQITSENKLLFLAKNVPAKGYALFYIKDGKGKTDFTPMAAESKQISTDYFDISFDENMNISSMFAKKQNRFVAPEGEVLGKITAYDDIPHQDKAWNVYSYYKENSREINDVSECEIIENGCIRTVYKVVRKFNNSTINQFYIVYADFDRVDVEYKLDWHEHLLMLKADYPVDVNSLKATFDIQFGNIERSTHENSLIDFAHFEVPAQKWADLSDNSFGVSILNDCKYGYSVKDGRIQPTLLRCAVAPYAEQDQGEHNFIYSIYPHYGAVSESEVNTHAMCLNTPLICRLSDAHDGELDAVYSLMSNDKSNVIIDTVKTAEDSNAVIVRMYETWNKTSETTLTLGTAAKQIFECNMLEEEDILLNQKTDKIMLNFKPFEIKTLKIVF